MEEFEKLLDKIAQGQSSLAPARQWLDKALAEPHCDHDVLLAALARAQQHGLLQPLAEALRNQIKAAREPPLPGAHRGATPAGRGGLGSEDRTERADQDRTIAALDQERTLLTIPPTAPASTAPPPDRTDQTVLTTDSGAAQAPASASASTTGEDYDPFAPDVHATAEASDSTIAPSSGGNALLRAPGGQDKVGPGSVLKSRFELVNVLGEGGMGKVYRARDLLRVEAQDKNPYIAVKTLSGDFREHPEAFIALQREASKTQKLAHPNIATVHDFDRDGNTVYMTMELMEGEELSAFIKRLPSGGLPVDEAMNIIRQMCNGLAYAHAKGLVHSDFKPGNVFLTKDGAVKLLDFGIARASKTRRDASGETTIFDPIQLGALTPAYATLEMFEGEDPDPRDDIYALACVAYELLTGRHPFNKLSAPKVLEKGLKPAAVAKLTRRQNRALMKALALERADRTATVEEFWREIQPHKSRALPYGVIAAVTLALLALLAYKPLEDYLQARRNDALIAQLAAGHADVPAILKRIGTLDAASQRYILENAKNRVIKYFEAQAEAFVDQSRGQYNYLAALEEIAAATRYYPDSAELLQEKTSLESRRARLLAELTRKFNELLAADKVLPGSGEDIADVVKMLRTADPADPLLHDERLTNRYAELVRRAAASGDYRQADKILDVGLGYAPADAELLNLRDSVTAALKRQRDAARIAALEQSLSAALPKLHTLADFDGVRAQLLELRTVAPQDPLLAKVAQPLDEALQTELAGLGKRQQWPQAEDRLLQYARLLSLPALFAEREALSRAEVQAGYVPADLQARLDRLQAARTSVEQLLAKPQYAGDWNSRLMSAMHDTAALLQLNDLQNFAQLRNRVAETYLALARRLMRENRFDAAAASLEAGARYAPDLPQFAAAHAELTTARQAFAARQAARLKQAQISALQNQFQALLNAGQISEAKQTYTSLQRTLPASDPFFTQVAPKAYALAYLALARARAGGGDYAGAVTLVKGGLQYQPLDSLKQALAQYSAQADRQALLAMAASLQPGDVPAFQSRLQSVQQEFPQARAQIADTALQRLAERITGLKDSDPALAASLLGAARSAFPGSRRLRDIRLPAVPAPSRFATLGRQALSQNALSAAQDYLAQGQKRDSGSADLAQFGRELQAAENNANRYYLAYQEYMRAGQSAQAKAYLAEAIRLWSDNRAWRSEYQRNFAATAQAMKSPNGGRPCTADLAGYGRLGRAECYDLLGGGLRGPTLVVIPSGGGMPTPFAIGKYEVSVGEINAYCRASGQCRPLPGDSSLPATDLPYREVRDYLAWLSAKSGEHYFLPSAAQYRYAASVGGTDTNRDFNCRVTLSGQLVKGLTLINIETGRSNAWGLVNYAGNAQEWVQGPNGLLAAGGDYKDPLSLCGTDLLRPSNGAADPLTGFRVARQLDR